jgi:hypothetical protein
MTTEQVLLEKWRSLPPDKQQEVVDFVEFLQNRQSPEVIVRQNHRSPLGTQLQQIRERIVASGTPLLSDEEIDRELAKRRGGYQELE